MWIKGIEQRPCAICKYKKSRLKSEPCHSCTKTGDFSSPGFEEEGYSEGDIGDARRQEEREAKQA